jgi:hypothetical protein
MSAVPAAKLRTKRLPPRRLLRRRRRLRRRRLPLGLRK